MPGYGIGILPLLELTKDDDPIMKHAAYADDLGGGSRVENLRKWWDRVCQFGPKLGYFPKPSKSWLVVKEERLEEANAIFADTGVNVTTKGRKYLGGFVGTREGAIKYVNELQEEWLEQLQVLTEVAKAEPQSAYASFTSGFRHKVTYFMRTIPDLEDVLVPLDKFIDEQFIPAITDGHVLSKDDRSLLSLPVRLGGLGIPIFSKSCTKEFEYSLKATSTLRRNIVAQDPVEAE